MNFISLVTSCAGLQKKQPQTTSPMSFTWASQIAQSCIQAAPSRDLREKFVTGATFNDCCAQNFATKWQLAPVWLVDGPILVLNYVYLAKTGGFWYRWHFRAPTPPYMFFTFCAGLQEEELQTAHLVSFTWTSHIAASVLTGH